MDKKKYLITYIIFVIIGAVLLGLGIAGIVNEYWSGMGSGLLVVGALRLLRMYRLRNNSVYRERVETAATDERNHFIRAKAWAWTGYIYILTASVVTIVLRILGYDLLAAAAGYSVCFMVLVFWLTYMVLNKKY